MLIEGELLLVGEERLLERRARPAARLGRGRPRAGGEAAQVDDLVAARPIADGDDLCGREVLDDVDELADRLRQGHRVTLLLLSRQLLARLDDGAALEDASVGRHLLAVWVDEDVGDADGVLVIVVATVEGGDGAVRPLHLHHLRLRDAVEEADDARPAARDAELPMRGWMHVAAAMATPRS